MIMNMKITMMKTTIIIILVMKMRMLHLIMKKMLNVFNPAMQSMLASGSRLDMAMMDQSINQQAQMIAYLNDFKLMFVATLLVVPLVLLIRPAKKIAGDMLAHAAAD